MSAGTKVTGTAASASVVRRSPCQTLHAPDAEEQGQKVSMTPFFLVQALDHALLGVVRQLVRSHPLRLLSRQRCGVVKKYFMPRVAFAPDANEVVEPHPETEPERSGLLKRQRT